MVRDLVDQAVNLVKARKKEEVKERAEQLVEDIILDILIPPVKSKGRSTGSFQLEEDTGHMPNSDEELNEKTRERFREKIRNGELDERKIEINIKKAAGGNMGMVGGQFLFYQHRLHRSSECYWA